MHGRRKLGYENLDAMREHLRERITMQKVRSLKIGHKSKP